ncbi:GNAT family N-acetyltransferase [Paenibacillus silvae]|uniref:GNAT family N-acetyltransferase n=1 Tax=Paenibacillus silvae TaxID=1325358 RepID=UPI002006113D|nr:GNAT family protein [Paenibacillus silvae]MCK6076963.1 GNAT family N-acetyltransferase [Paenibacillus silvae]MCK6152723.1 GNAT family N-acetyltransferase [Paenibacillus silvae]MCK6269530.1 GNAT family N-acetyltransferase [Paenibacillus silvae]
MLPFQVNDAIQLKLIQPQNRDELYSLIDLNRVFLREWLGIITTAIKKLITYLFNDLKLNRVIIQCAESNIRSRAIPENLGFVNEGTSRQAQWLYDHYEIIVTNSLLSSEWQECVSK